MTATATSSAWFSGVDSTGKSSLRHHEASEQAGSFRTLRWAAAGGDSAMYQNALSHTDKRTAREIFWHDQRTWPIDTKDHEFLGRVVLRYGRAFHGDNWRDSDPGCALEEPLPDRLNLYMPIPEITRASEALRESLPAYASRCLPGLLGEGPDFPTREEWKVAQRLIAARRNVQLEGFRRYLDVCITLSDEFKHGKTKTATRGFKGGEIVPLPWHFWNTESHWSRLDTCRIDLADPFSWTPAIVGKEWIFIERSTQGVAASGARVNTAPITDEIVATLAKGPRRPAGRKSKYSWDEMIGEFVRIVHEEGIPSEPNISELARRLLDWAAERWTELPSEKATQDKIRLWISGCRA